MNEIVGILAVTTVFADISGMYLCFSEKALRSEFYTKGLVM